MKTMVVGITGGIGSGKSEVCRIIRELGASVLVADELAREVIETDPSVKQKLKRALRFDPFDRHGRLDRKRLADAIFTNPRLRTSINQIVHPAVLRRINGVVQEARKRRSKRMLLIEAALLLESGADKMVDYVVVVDASKQLRMPRAARHLGLAKQEVKRRIHAQLSSRDMRRHADFVIHNDGTLEDLRKKTELLWRILVGIHSTSGLT